MSERWLSRRKLFVLLTLQVRHTIRWLGSGRITRQLTLKEVSYEVSLRVPERKLQKKKKTFLMRVSAVLLMDSEAQQACTERAALSEITSVK